jgi:hypothetical protein
MGKISSNQREVDKNSSGVEIQLSNKRFGLSISEIVSYGTMLLTLGGTVFVLMKAIPEQEKLREDIVNLKVSNAVIVTEVNHLKTEVKEITK